MKAKGKSGFQKPKLISKSRNSLRSALSNKTAYPVVDLFAGPGGLGEGFSSMTCPSDSNRYAFRTAISIENEKHAYATLKLRHFYREFPPGRVPDEYYDYLADRISVNDLYSRYPREAFSADNSVWKCTLGKEPQGNVKKRISSTISGTDKWVLLGGPPCQAYSLVGRSRMINLPDFDSDPRHFLYRKYLRIIADHKPPVFVMENVKGLVSAKNNGKYVINDILRALTTPEKNADGKKSDVRYKLYSLADPGLKKINTDPRSFIVKAEKYGIPQARHRIFIVGIRENINMEPAVLSKSSPPTVKQIIGNLPAIRSGLSRSEDSYEAWTRRLMNLMEQKWFIQGHTNGLAGLGEQAKKTLLLLNRSTMERSSSKYSAPSSMKNWLYDHRLKTLSSHESRSHMDSDIQRYFFAALYSSVNHVSPKLADFPDSLLPKHRNAYLGKEGKMFSDRFRVQLPDIPSRTITSHISKDGHSFIHYDPAQCRSLTVREAARLQTFPDNYKFEGPRTAQYQQVGNAVPPLLARKIAEIIYEILDGMK